MLRRIRRRLTYANVTASMALFIALGGVSYAAVTLPKNSVGARQLKNGSVTGADVKNNSLTSVDVKNGSLAAADFGGSVQGPKGDTGATGPKGDQGAKGDTGATGARGPSDAYYVFNNANGVDSKTLSLVLPAGKYSVTGSMYAINGSGASAKVDTSCSLDSPADTNPDHEGNAALSIGFAATTTYGALTTDTVLNMPSGGTVNLNCSKFGAGSATFYQARILAIKVETLN